MLRDTVSGLERVLRTDIDVPKVVLVIGPPGSMKTSFCFSVMSKHMASTDQLGVYLTLEETAESHLKNMKSIGIPFAENVIIADFTDIRELEDIGDEDAPDYIALIEKMVKSYKQKHGKAFTMLAVDSLGALYSLMDDDASVRKSMYHFFKSMRDLGLFTMLIMEGSVAEGRFYSGSEAFLSDGVVYLVMPTTKLNITIFDPVYNIRACYHRLERLAV